MRASLTLFVLASVGAGVASAQGPTPVSDALRSSEKDGARHLIAAAETMPAEKYGFKPTPAQMSFGKVISHLSRGNDFLCSKISGTEAPKRAELDEKASKDKLVAALRASFQFCETALAKVNDSDLATKVPFFGGHEVTRAEAMFDAAVDWADHYSQLAIYLRLNGLLPPTAKEKEE
jgi:uncharacterized damage-inducible protein DinB